MEDSVSHNKQTYIHTCYRIIQAAMAGRARSRSPRRGAGGPPAPGGSAIIIINYVYYDDGDDH